MILLLGATTYVGQAFARLLRGRNDPFVPLSRHTLDYSRFELLFDYVRKIKPDLVINADELSDKPNANSSDTDCLSMLQANTLLPQVIARVCSMTKTMLGHVSSGSIYTGSKVLEEGSLRTEEDLRLPSARAAFALHPETFLGFTELDAPNFSFKQPPCTFYSGTKALAEEALRDSPAYIWRLRLPFNERDEPDNFLSQLQDGFKSQDSVNSVSHLEDCVGACLDLWERRAPIGIYNVVNPGPVRTVEVLQLIHRSERTKRPLRLLLYEPEPVSCSEGAARPDCILDCSKLLRAGVKLREAKRAVAHSVQNWEPQAASVMKIVK